MEYKTEGRELIDRVNKSWCLDLLQYSILYYKHCGKYTIYVDGWSRLRDSSLDVLIDYLDS